MIRIWRTTTLAGFVWLMLYLALTAVLGLNFGAPATEVLRRQLGQPSAFIASAVTSGGGWVGPVLVARFKSNQQTLRTLIHSRSLEPTSSLECRRHMVENLAFFLLWGPRDEAYWKCRVGVEKGHALYVLYHSEQHFVYVYMGKLHPQTLLPPDPYTEP